MSEQQYGRRAVEMGPTGRTVADNLARLRNARGLSTRQLATALEQVGRSISPSGISRMEKAERHMTADDLAALAVVLRVSPSAFLLPLEDSDEYAVEITGAGAVPADVAWDWADGKRPVRWLEGDPSTASLDYRLYSRPPGRREVHGIVLRPRGERGRQQVAEIRRAYRMLQDHGLDIRELQRLDADAFEQLMGDADGQSLD
ncbi:helix-turn-helix domain-containing protein [Streptomyces wuyuanensis]|uniref:Helix-turn-helix domain-containing protein n=1 Tax=Streptomyces wuyuanensis TaxID=1196353 RepID=A0A1H0EGW9_9ACTN|nr:helix-turn-helix transcriptional regulator [Streptomyces wuyuanensis]SDN81603.1 Helix-turn-helix domain-containing protein [Streptomyces wuyuanensis]